MNRMFGWAATAAVAVVLCVGGDAEARSCCRQAKVRCCKPARVRCCSAPKTCCAPAPTACGAAPCAAGCTATAPAANGGATEAPKPPVERVEIAPKPAT